MACRRRCGCLPTSDLGEPGGVAGLTSGGFVDAPIEVTFASTDDNLVIPATSGAFEPFPGGPTVTFDTLDGRPRLILLSAAGVSHTVGQLVVVGIGNGVTGVKYVAMDVLAGKNLPVSLVARIPGGVASMTYTIFGYAANTGAMTLLAAADGQSPILLDVLRV